MTVEANLLEYMYENSTYANIDILPFLISNFPEIKQSAQAGIMIENLAVAGLINPSNNQYKLWAKASLRITIQKMNGVEHSSGIEIRIRTHLIGLGPFSPY